MLNRIPSKGEKDFLQRSSDAMLWQSKFPVLSVGRATSMLFYSFSMDFQCFQVSKGRRM